MRKWALTLLFILVLAFPGVAHSQAVLVLNSLEIDLWPEYDKPSVLVIYRLVLSPQTALPVEMTLRIPASVGEPNAVAASQVDGVLQNINYDRQVSNGWAYIHFTVGKLTTQIQMEYYDPNLERSGNARHFNYLWPGDYAISSLTIQVQQPLNATDMRIVPSQGEGIVSESDGLTYFTQVLGAIPAAQTVKVMIDYNKPDDKLSVESLQVQPSAPITENTSFGLLILPYLPWILGVVGAVLIIGGILWYWRSSGQPIRLPRWLRGARDTGKINTGAGAPGGGDIYCHQCGKRASPGDIFCRSCGTRLRRE